MNNVVGGALKLKKPIGGITKKWVTRGCCNICLLRAAASDGGRSLAVQEEEERLQGPSRSKGDR